MASVNPYLNFNGTTEEAFNFYKSVFGGEFTALHRFKDVPGNEQMPAEVQDKIMHIALPVKGTTLMATDALESMGQKLNTGNSFYININVDSEEEADKIYHALSAGGKIEMPLEKTLWGSYFGAFADKFGTQWMINYDYPKN